MKKERPRHKGKFPCTEMKIKSLKEGSIVGEDEPWGDTLGTFAANGKDPFLVKCSVIFLPLFREANRA